MAFDKLRVQLAGLLLRNTNNAYNQNSPYVPNRSEPPNRSVEEWLETYGRSRLLGVVSKIAEDLSFATGRLLRKDINGEDEELPENHPFWRFWNAPNPLHQFTREAVWQLHQEYLLLTGESFMVIEKDLFGYPVELWPLPPNWVSGTPTAGNPFYTIRTPSSLFAQIHVNDMFVQMELNPADPYGRGLGKAQGIADEVEIDEYAAAFEKRFFYNDATPSSVIAIEGADADAIKRFDADWNNRFQGVENSHKTAVTSGKVSAVKLADNMKDLDMVNGRLFLRDTTLEHFHMPREIMGITENSNRSTAEAAQYIYAQNVQMPYLRKRQSAVNIQLLPYWGEDIRFEYDEIVPRNQEYEKQVAFEGFEKGVILLNEAREKIDMAPLDNGDVLQAPLLFGYVRPDQDLTQAGLSMDQGGVVEYYDQVYEETDPVTGQKEIKASISRLDQQAMAQLERAQRQQQRQSQNAVTQHFSWQRRTLMAAIRASSKSEKDQVEGVSDFAALQKQLDGVTDSIRRMEIITGYVDKLVDWNQDERQITDLVANIWTGSYEKAQGIMENMYDLKNPYKPQARDIFKRMGGSKISDDISQTTRDSICSIIEQGLADGADINELAQRVGASADLSPARARLISEQETYNALSAANYDSMEEGGVTHHKWVTRGDGDVRDEHRPLNGQVRKIGERFSNGLLHPRERQGDAKQTIHCRCWTVPLRNRDHPLIAA